MKFEELLLAIDRWHRTKAHTTITYEARNWTATFPDRKLSGWCVYVFTVPAPAL